MLMEELFSGTALSGFICTKQKSAKGESLLQEPFVICKGQLRYHYATFERFTPLLEGPF